MRVTGRHLVNTHKVLTPVFITTLMYVYENTGVGATVYLALHGTYCVNWMMKELIFPDKTFDRLLTKKEFALVTVAIYNYWWSPWLLITTNHEPHNATIFTAVFLNISGTFLHYCCDAQKYYMLQERKRLITTGFFARSRNLNYLGEIMIYLGFSIMAEHVIPLLFLVVMVMFVFVPSMKEKDRSLSRYEEFEQYAQHSNMLIPML